MGSGRQVDLQGMMGQLAESWDDYRPRTTGNTSQVISNGSSYRTLQD